MTKINDRKFSVVVPQFDNDGHKIDTDLIREVAEDMSEHFGGSNTDEIRGCWETGDGTTQCEKNVIISSVRKSEWVDEPRKQFGKDEEFIEDLAEDTGEELGQESVTTMTSNTEMSFAGGKFKEELPKDKRIESVFQDL